MELLQATLEALCARLDAALQVSDPRAEPWVTLTNPVNLDGSVSENTRNKLVMALAGLRTEALSRNAPGFVPVPSEPRAPAERPRRLNASVLLFANFTGGNYATGVSAISRATAFFEQNPVFTPAGLPGLPANIDKVTLDFVNLDLMEASCLMAMFGLKYLPS